MQRILRVGVIVLVSIMTLILTSPWVLAFPYEARYGDTIVRAETPIGPEMQEVLARADELVAASPLQANPPARRLYLTDGGWRWRALALQSAGGFGLRRPFLNSIVINRADIAADRVENGAPVGGVRTLSGVIAHETTHLMVARRLGEVQAILLPEWKREGVADVVARESSLSAEEAERLRASGQRTRALDYYDYRQRVEATLASNGSLDTLLRD